MDTDSAHSSRWEISEVVFGIPLFISIVLHWLIPISIAEGIVRVALVPVGAALGIAGIGLVVLARREFAQHHQSMEPGHPISQVVDTGVFSISRNPLYLGIICTMAGIALVLDILWILILLAPAILLCQIVLIAPEERYLENKFGQDYTAYAASVHRWLGRNSNLSNGV